MKPLRTGVFSGISLAIFIALLVIGAPGWIPLGIIVIDLVLFFLSGVQLARGRGSTRTR